MYPITPALVDPNNRLTNYIVTTNSGVLTVGASLTWAAPASILYGTPLSAIQLNASAGIPGTFVYTPAAGAELTVGSYTLSVMFTPSDSGRFQQRNH